MNRTVFPFLHRVRPGTRLGAVTALFLLVFGFLPIVNWVPGGRTAPWYSVVAENWISGSEIVVGLAIVLSLLSRRLIWLWRPDPFRPLRDFYLRRPTVYASAVALAAFFLYAVIARFIFDARPLMIDEIAQLYQARIFAGGHLTGVVPLNPEFFTALHLVFDHGKVYSQFPPGWPAMLALGVVAGVPWLVGPLVGALCVFVFAQYLRERREGAATAAGAVLLLAAAPFMAFLASTHMNHVATMLGVLVAVAGLARLVSKENPDVQAALMCGFGFGIASTMRPVDAFAFAVPAAIWLLIRTIRDHRRLPELLGAGLGVSFPLVAMLWFNTRTSGHPLRFGYEVLWGARHALGFHAAPWGEPHTPRLGLELINIYFLRFQTALFETPIPALTAAIIVVALASRLGPFARYWLMSSTLLVLLYFAYWHEGFFWGPRFVFLLIVPFVVASVRLPGVLRTRLGNGLFYRACCYTMFLSVLFAAIFTIPVRLRQYSGGFSTQRWDAARAARVAGVDGALVLVRESWSSQLVVRLWARHISHSDAEELSRNIDGCVLEHALGDLERSNADSASSLARIRDLLADSSRIQLVQVAPDVYEHMKSGATYDALCSTRFAEDRSGVAVLAPLLVINDSRNIYARDLHARDTVLLARYRARPVYLLRPRSSHPSDPPAFFPVRWDSVRADWQQAR